MYLGAGALKAGALDVRISIVRRNGIDSIAWRFLRNGGK